MNCQSKSCESEANSRVFWPGKLTLMCIPCAARALRTADAMGFQLIIEEIREPECTAEHPCATCAGGGGSCQGDS